MAVEWLAALGKTIKDLLMGGDVTAHISYDKHTKRYKVSGSDNQVGNVTNNNTHNTINNVIIVPAGSENQLAEVLKKQVFDHDILFLEDESKRVLSDFQKFENDIEVKRLVSFFAGKVPMRDAILMRTGLYIHYLQENDKRKEAQKRKNEVIALYPGRGKNVVNLASAGYFATHIKPLYELMCKEDGFNDQDFKDEYEKIVTSTPYAVFVHSGMSVDKIISEVEERASIQLKYHVDEDCVNIHGFGSNVERIDEARTSLQKKYQVTSHVYTKGIQIAHVKVFTKKRNP